MVDRLHGRTGVEQRKRLPKITSMTAILAINLGDRVVMMTDSVWLYQGTGNIISMASKSVLLDAANSVHALSGVTRPATLLRLAARSQTVQRPC